MQFATFSSCFPGPCCTPPACCPQYNPHGRNGSKTKHHEQLGHTCPFTKSSWGTDLDKKMPFCFVFLALFVCLFFNPAQLLNQVSSSSSKRAKGQPVGRWEDKDAAEFRPPVIKLRHQLSKDSSNTKLQSCFFPPFPSSDQKQHLPAEGQVPEEHGHCSWLAGVGLEMRFLPLCHCSPSNCVYIPDRDKSQNYVGVWPGNHSSSKTLRGLVFRSCQQK